jgi:hypothetical protein
MCRWKIKANLVTQFTARPSLTRKEFKDREQLGGNAMWVHWSTDQPNLNFKLSYKEFKDREQLRVSLGSAGLRRCVARSPGSVWDRSSGLI